MCKAKQGWAICRRCLKRHAVTGQKQDLNAIGMLLWRRTIFALQINNVVSMLGGVQHSTENVRVLAHAVGFRFIVDVRAVLQV